MNTITLEIELLTPTSFASTPRSLGVASTREVVSGRALWAIALTAATRSQSTEDVQRLLAGEVRFGDGLPVHNGERALPMPRSWYREKGTSTGGVHNNAAAPPPPTGAWRAVGAGWMLPRSAGGAATLKLNHSVVLKTAVGGDQRPEEGLLFGIELLDAGLRFRAEISGPDASFVERVVASIVGTQRLGRSRGAEFGRVAVRRVAGPAEAHKPVPASGSVAFLVATPLVLRDASTGAYTHAPSPAAFGLPGDWVFDAARSAVRVANYTPFNGLRRRPELERAAFEPGTVLVFKGATAVDTATVAAAVAAGVGEFCHEGYGELLVHPRWLAEAEPGAIAEATTVAPSVASAPRDELAQWATHRAAQVKARTQLHRAAIECARNIGNVPGLRSSQWGELHALGRQLAAAGAGNAEVLKRFVAWAQDGPRKARWGATVRGKALHDLVKRSAEQVDQPAVFLELLASAAMRVVNSETTQKAREARP